MKKSRLVFAIVLTALGFRACYLKDYVTVLKYPHESSKVFISQDSITISPSIYVEDFITLGVVINFETVPDSFLVEQLNVAVKSEDNQAQVFLLKNVSAIIHPVITTGEYLPKLDAKNFNTLPDSCKIIRNSGLPYNAMMFYFRTINVGRSDFYCFEISGSFIYKKQRFSFKKNITVERKIEYRPYRMMT